MPIPAYVGERASSEPRVVGTALSTLGKGMGPTLVAKAREMGVKLPVEFDDPGATLTPGLVVPFLRDVAGHFFPGLVGNVTDHD